MTLDFVQFFSNTSDFFKYLFDNYPNLKTGRAEVSNANIFVSCGNDCKEPSLSTKYSRPAIAMEGYDAPNVFPRSPSVTPAKVSRRSC